MFSCVEGATGSLNENFTLFPRLRKNILHKTPVHSHFIQAPLWLLSTEYTNNLLLGAFFPAKLYIGLVTQQVEYSLPPVLSCLDTSLR